MQRESIGAAIRQRFSDLVPVLNERERRLWAAVEANSLGYGGISVVARTTGISRRAIPRGLKELSLNPTPWHTQRISGPGGGRKPLGVTQPALPDALMVFNVLTVLREDRRLTINRPYRADHPGRCLIRPTHDAWRLLHAGPMLEMRRQVRPVHSFFSEQFFMELTLVQSMHLLMREVEQCPHMERIPDPILLPPDKVIDNVFARDHEHLCIEHDETLICLASKSQSFMQKKERHGSGDAEPYS